MSEIILFFLAKLLLITVMMYSTDTIFMLM